MDKYGLIGHPLAHSFSIEYFNNKFKSENLDAKYFNFDIPSIKEFDALIAENPELKGLNVTTPYKEQIIKYLDELDVPIKEIGAVNVIKFIPAKSGKIKLKGYNSDVVGFADSIAPILDAHHTKALILGSGGAAKAVAYALRNLHIEYVFVSREAAKGQLVYADLTKEIMEEYAIIINATPLGMYPNVDMAPDIPYEYITEKHLLYDLLYNPDVTKFMKLGQEQGAAVKNGLEMLLLQAFASWNIWNE